MAVKELFEGSSNSPSNTTNSTILGPSSSATPSSQSRQLGHGAVAGIAVGCTAFVVICAAGTTFAMKQKSKNHRNFTELPNRRSPQFSPSESHNCIELSAFQRPQEILTEHQDRVELPQIKAEHSRAELSSGTSMGQVSPV